MSFIEYLIFVVVIRKENCCCYFGAPWYSMILQWYRQQRSDHYRFPSSSDDIQVVYESKNYFVVNKDDLVPIDAYEAPSQVNVTQQMKKWFAKRETERFLHQNPPPTDEQKDLWKKSLAQKSRRYSILSSIRFR